MSSEVGASETSEKPRIPERVRVVSPSCTGLRRKQQMETPAQIKLTQPRGTTLINMGVGKLPDRARAGVTVVAGRLSGSAACRPLGLGSDAEGTI
jgi:hypothetical protein